MLPDIPGEDIPWSEKKNMAIFRGAATGSPVGEYREKWTSEQKQQLPALDKCLYLRPRCRLIYNHVNSTLVDAKYTFKPHRPSTTNPMVNEIQKTGVRLEGDRITREEYLKYKAIIMLEGNDVSSGLKWALYSNSVVMTQKSTCTSWAMEEALEPWVHYVPLNDDLSDVEEKMQWIIDNDEEAQRIAHQGSLWIKDLVFHPDAETDNELIFDEMARRYIVHFVHSPDMDWGFSQ